MKEYLSRSIRKFKEDAFSKFIYDFLKWIIILTTAFILANYIPSIKTVSNFLSTTLNLSVFEFTIICLIIVIVNTTVLYLVFKKKYKNLQDVYFTDKLTGLKNQAALEKYLNKKIIELKKSNSACSLILMDIDNFKAINVKFGYNSANEVIKKISGVLARDIRYTDEVFRYFQKGDEFLIILNDTGIDGALNAANRKRELISKIKFELNNNTEQFTVSCGVTEFNNLTDNYLSVTDRLNKALLDAKAQPNKNSVIGII